MTVCVCSVANDWRRSLDGCDVFDFFSDGCGIGWIEFLATVCVYCVADDWSGSLNGHIGFDLFCDGCVAHGLNRSLNGVSGFDC